MLETVKTRDVRRLYIFDELSQVEGIHIGGGFRRATALPTYLKTPGRRINYVGAGGDSIMSLQAAAEFFLPLFEYAAIDIEDFTLDVESMIDQRLEALIDSALLGTSEDEIPCVSEHEVTDTFRQAFAGQDGTVVHVLELEGLRAGFAFGVLDHAGVLTKRGDEYGMFADLDRIRFVRLNPVPQALVTRVQDGSSNASGNEPE